MRTQATRRMRMVVMITIGFMVGAPHTAQLAQDRSSTVSAQFRRFDDCGHPGRGTGHGKGHARVCRSGSSSGVARGDFDGDGFGDLAIGVPNENVPRPRQTTAAAAGQVTIIYGSPIGLAATAVEGLPAPRPSQLWHQSVGAMADTVEANDRFGSALASGDFDADGFSDLAVSVPGERDASGVQRGAIHLLFGSASGLTATGNRLISGTQFSLSGQPLFLLDSLGWGDFNKDGFGDLVVEAGGAEDGVPPPPSSPVAAAIVLPGSSTGLDPETAAVFSIDDAIFTNEGGTFVDMNFSAGDVDGNGFDDLVIGKPAAPFGGAIEILDGSPQGLTTARRQIIDQRASKLSDTASSDRFGAALAVGDFDGDGFDDVAVGVPGEGIGSSGAAGSVEVLMGSPDGADPSNALRLRQGAGGIPGVAQSSDAFGAALAAGDFDGNGRKDLAIGVPGENVGTIARAGGINVIHGSATGLSPTAGPGVRFFTQTPSTGIAEAGDRFGSALTAWNFGSGSEADLAIGVPSEDVGNLVDAGAVNVIYGSATGLSPSSQFWTSNSPGVPEAAEAGDRFGAAVY